MSRIENMFFIAGLPRAGSTLLSAILRQNPAIHAGMSSPLEHIVASALESMSFRNNFHHFITDAQRKEIVRGIFDAYYADIANEHIFDTNRIWPARLPILVDLFPKTKIVCCVRDLPAVLNSFEHLVIEHPYTISRLFNSSAYNTVYGRYDSLMGANGSVGRAHQSLKEGFYGPHRDRLVFVEYEDLVSKPAQVLKRIYAELGISAFAHDFDAVSHQESKFDADFGFPDMHTVRKKVAAHPKPMLLPDDLVKRLQGAEFWK